MHEESSWLCAAAESFAVENASTKREMGSHDLLRRNRIQTDPSNGSIRDGEKNNKSDNSNDEKKIDHRDNWIAKLLYGSKVGLAVNFLLIISCTVHYYWTIENKLKDDHFNVNVFHGTWLVKGMQLLKMLLVDILMDAVILLAMFPASRSCRSTVYYWMVGTVCCGLMYATISISDRLFHFHPAIRIIIFADFMRLSMKMASFLTECNLSEHVHRRSTRATLIYFILVPTLVYQIEYEKAKRIRWIKVFSHIVWAALGIIVVSLYVFELTDAICIFDLASEPLINVLYKMSLFYLLQIPLYFLIVWFFFFENLNGLFGELLRFPHLDTFGTIGALLEPSSFARAFNTSVNRWIMKYIQEPIMKSGGSRSLAVAWVMSFSAVFHILGFFYISGVFSIVNILYRLYLVPALSVPMESGFKQKVVAISVLVACSLEFPLYTAEYNALNYSTIPSDGSPKFRVIPVFITFLLKKHFDLDVSF